MIKKGEVSMEKWEEEIVVTDSDLDNLYDFANAFDAEMPEEMAKIIEAFKEDRSIENQKAVRKELSRWVAEAEKGEFTDPMWDGVKKDIEEKKILDE